LGRPYVYKNQANKLYVAGSKPGETFVNATLTNLKDREKWYSGYLSNAMHKVDVTYNHYYEPEKYVQTGAKQNYAAGNSNYYVGVDGQAAGTWKWWQQWGDNSSYNRWYDTEVATDYAWLAGYRIRGGYSTGIQTEANGVNYTGYNDGEAISHNVYVNNNDSYVLENQRKVTKDKDVVKNGINERTTSLTHHDGTAWVSSLENVKYYTDTRSIFDYERDDNLTPTKATYEVRFRNRKDQGANDYDYLRAAHISEVTLKSKIDENLGTDFLKGTGKAFRLQNLYVPAYLVGSNKCDDECTTCSAHQNGATDECPGDGTCTCTTCDGRWFNATKFTFTYLDANQVEKTVELTWDQLREAGCVSGPWKVAGAGVLTKDTRFNDKSIKNSTWANTGYNLGRDSWGNLTYGWNYNTANNDEHTTANKAGNFTAEPATAVPTDERGYFKLLETKGGEGADKDDLIADPDGDYMIDVERLLRVCSEPVYQNDDATQKLLGFKNLAGEGATGAAAVTNTDGEPLSLSTYKTSESTNTNFVSGTANIMEDEKQYARALFTSVQLEFKALNGNRRVSTTLLDSDQSLTRRSEAFNADGKANGGTAGTDTHFDTLSNYAFRYDGVYVDRPIELFTTATQATNLVRRPLSGQVANVPGDGSNFGNPGNWTYDSTPTFGKQANSYTGTSSRHELSVPFLRFKDPNAETNDNSMDPTTLANNVDRYLDKYAKYNVSHTVGTFDMSYVRGRKIAPAINHGTTTETNEAGSTTKTLHKDTVFAYDADKDSMTNVFSYEPTNTANDIPDGALYAGDYVEYTLYLGANLRSSLPLQHVDARFTVSKGQRIVGWEVVREGDKALNTVGAANDWHNADGTEIADDDAILGDKVTGKRFGVTDDDGNIIRTDVATVTALMMDGSENITMDTVPASTDVTKVQHVATRPVSTEDGLEGATEQVVVQPDGANGEFNEGNRTLVFSVGSKTQEMQPGEGVYLRVITQMTDEFEDATYNSADNQAFTGNNDAPKSTAKTATATLKATSAPIHGYTQYRFTSNDNGSVSSSQNFKTRYDEGLYAITYNQKTGMTANLTNRRLYGGEASSSVRFYSHTSDSHAALLRNAPLTGADAPAEPLIASTHNTRDANGQLTSLPVEYYGTNNQSTRHPLVYSTTAVNHYDDPKIAYEWVKNSATRGKAADQDGNPLKLSITNLKNTTFHTNDVRVTVRFTDGFNTDLQIPTGKQIFEVYGHNIDYHFAAGTTDVDGNLATAPAAGDVGTNLPANVTSGLNGKGTLPVTKKNAIKAQGRENICIEYYVPLASDTDREKAQSIMGASSADLVVDANGVIVGAWFEEDQDKNELTQYMEGRSHKVAGTESVYDINLYREAQAMRWTYYDVPATADGVNPFKLDNVVLDGVGRFVDTRGITGRWQDIANAYTQKVRMDVAYSHFHNEATTLDFRGAATRAVTDAAKRGDYATTADVIRAMVEAHLEGMEISTDVTAVAGVPGQLALAALALAAAGEDPDNNAGAVHHGEWRVKQNAYAETNDITVYRRSPNAQFQNQVFQTREQALGLPNNPTTYDYANNPAVVGTDYDENAKQKTGYVAGETFWYKDTVVNANLEFTVSEMNAGSSTWTEQDGVLASTNHGHGSSSSTTMGFTLGATTAVTWQARVSSEGNYDKLWYEIDRYDEDNEKWVRYT
ncbi:MAG: hypothetical protein UCH28_11930, partial [Adlercreutzia sp.]|nr:hypothetical protein [Adlercreutzia sp.]